MASVPNLFQDEGCLTLQKGSGELRSWEGRPDGDAARAASFLSQSKRQRDLRMVARHASLHLRVPFQSMLHSTAIQSNPLARPLQARDYRKQSSGFTKISRPFVL